jgi:drug/metabolite transporter superfamily protein YnfA
MNVWGIAFLVGAAALEVGGDAAMRAGLRGRAWAFLLGAALLACYGLLVNQPALPFNRLLGTYIAVFFVVSQLVAFAVFGERPTPHILAGGALVALGGIVVQLGAGRP